jgi:hypothetical protein
VKLRAKIIGHPELLDLPGLASTTSDVQAALDYAVAHLAEHGWDPTLRWYVNRWLDRAIELRASA